MALQDSKNDKKRLFKQAAETEFWNSFDDGDGMGMMLCIYLLMLNAQGTALTNPQKAKLLAAKTTADKLRQKLADVQNAPDEAALELISW